MTWTAPEGLDPECLALCQAMNAFDGIKTIESCCGHGTNKFRVFFYADGFTSLAAFSYAVDLCHSGVVGWEIVVWTDCSAYLCFILEGPQEAAAGDELALALSPLHSIS